MADLDQRIDNGLNESRMLLLGGQVLLGIAYPIWFQPLFAKTVSSAQVSQVIGIAITTAGLGWLLWPAAFHQIVGRSSTGILTSCAG